MPSLCKSQEGIPSRAIKQNNAQVTWGIKIGEERSRVNNLTTLAVITLFGLTGPLGRRRLASPYPVFPQLFPTPSKNGGLSLAQIHVCAKPAKQLRLHPLSSLGAVSNISHDIRTRREIVLEHWLSNSPHIGEDSLPEVPPQEFVYGPPFVIQELAIQEFTGYSE